MSTEMAQQDRVLPEKDQDPSMEYTASDPCTVSLVSRETRLIHKATYPQASPVMPRSKSQTATPTSSSTTAQNRPILPIQSDQPSIATLASYGIKVRDFAYESTLPPIAPIPRVPRQVQPGPRPLKRARKEYDNDEDTPSSLPSQPQAGPSAGAGVKTAAGSRKSKPLERKVTEPASDSDSTKLPSTHGRVFTGLDSYDPPARKPLRSHHSTIQYPAGTPPPLTSQSHDNLDLHPPSEHASQVDEPYIPTPQVTPNGSLHWPVPSCFLDDNSQSPIPCTGLDLASRASMTNELPLRDKSSVNLLFPPVTQSPSLLPPPHIVLSKPVAPSSARQRTSSSPIPAPKPSPPSSPGSPPQRYHLRKRPAAPPKSPSRPPSRAQASRNPSSRQQSFSAQAAHSASSARGSPRARPLRKRGNEESMVMG
jgi:hypothetical protein